MSEAQDFVIGLRGDWSGDRGMAACPICQLDATKRSLSIKDAGGRTLLTCHKSGCKASDIFSALRELGIVRGNGVMVPRLAVEVEQEREARQKQEAAKRRYCASVFHQSMPITGTLAAHYLEGRGVKGQWQKISNTLRFHPSLPHARTKQNYPAMIAQVRGPQGQPMGIHRTYLNADGSGKADLPGGAKMMLGPCASGAVRFGPDRPVIALAEGIETALSIGMASRMTVWACLSTSGLKGLILPALPVAGIIIIAADNDPAGLAAAQEAAGRFEAAGRVVSVISPQTEGADFNDVLRGAAS